MGQSKGRHRSVEAMPAFSLMRGAQGPFEMSGPALIPLLIFI
jgi:hypothetical protein